MLRRLVLREGEQIVRARLDNRAAALQPGEEAGLTDTRAQSGNYTRHYTDDGTQFFVSEDTGESVWSVPAGATIVGGDA